MHVCHEMRIWPVWILQRYGEYEKRPSNLEWHVLHLIIVEDASNQLHVHYIDLYL
jgi:hypothetical protein